MIPVQIKQSIHSLPGEKLDKLYSEYQDQYCNDDVYGFIDDLYAGNQISPDEYEAVQSIESSHLTSITDHSAGHIQESFATRTRHLDDHEFTVLQSIAHGAMGEILMARDNELGRTVALKKIHSHIADEPNYMVRFFKEAQITAQLEHPNIVPIYRMRVVQNHVGYTMKLIDGKTLKDMLEDAREQVRQWGRPDERHNLAALLQHFLKVCDAMHYAHRKGVIHRDLKPLNIMVGPYNDVYVMDWGIAKVINLSDDTYTELAQQSIHDDNDAQIGGVTQSGDMLGTPAYMSPEQAMGKHEMLDHRSDLFTLGLILYELIILRKPYKGHNHILLLSEARKGKIRKPIPFSRKLEVPGPLIAIVHKATRFKPEDRYDTVDEFATDIRRFLNGRAIQAQPDTLVQQAARWMNRHRVAAFNIFAYSIIAAFVITAGTLYMHQKDRIQAQLAAEHTSDFLRQVGSQAQHIDSRFLEYEAILEGIAAAASNLLNHGHADPSPYYLHTDYLIADTAPPDYTPAPAHNIPISVDWPVYKLAPGVTRRAAEPVIRRLNPLRHTLKRLIVRSHDLDIPINDVAAIRQVIRSAGLPISTFLGLEEGFLMDYPGRTGYTEVYDPRQRPWYRQALQQRRTGWTLPYIDVTGRGWMLPCTTPLYDTEGIIIGVAAVEMTLDYIREHLLITEAMQDIHAAYLLDNEGRVVVSTQDKAEQYAVGTLINTAAELPAYHYQEVVASIRDSTSEHGLMLVDEGAGERIISYYKLNSTGWYYVAEAAAADIYQ